MQKYTIAEIKAVQKLVDEAVAKALVGTGFEVAGSKGTYGDTLAVKISFQHADPAKKVAAERHDWNQLCSLFGLKPEHYGAEITHKGEVYIAVGFEPRRSKFPLRVKGKTNGRVILLTQMSIDRLAGPRKPIEEGVLIEVPAPKNVADLIRVRP